MGASTLTHRRAALRAAFVQHLTNATSAGNRVHSGRLMPLDDQDQSADLPAIVVHTRDPEQITGRSVSGWNGYEQRRTVVSVIAVTQSFGDIDDELDALAGEIEDAIQTWTIPGFEAAEIEPHTTASEDPEFDGSLTTGSTILRFPVVYLTPYRPCSDPYVTGDDEPLERSGAYPGGQVTAGCPTDNTGEACPIGDAELISNNEPIN